MLLIIHYKSPTGFTGGGVLCFFCVFVNPSFWVTVRPLISLFYFNTPPPFFCMRLGKLYDLLKSFRMPNNKTSCSVLSTYFRQNILIFLHFNILLFEFVIGFDAKETNEASVWCVIILSMHYLYHYFI